MSDTYDEQWVVTAAALTDGGVRYLTPARTWTSDLQQAWFGASEAAESMVIWARGQEHVICDPYMFALDRVDGALLPRTQREQIRAEGPAPTLARLGYVAEAPAQRRAV